jgi:hypothetical protein
LFCLFNEEAAASNPAGIHKYSDDLIGLLVPNPAGDGSIRQLAEPIVDRLANAEQAARAGRRRLVAETAVVRAFNDLMQEIGAPPSVRADEASVHRFRQHAASIQAFPALFSADRNGANCNPGEAVFLVSLLISDNGALLDGNLDGAAALMQRGDQRNGGGVSFGVAHVGGPESGASGLLSSYSLRHNFDANMVLFDHLAVTLGL